MTSRTWKSRVFTATSLSGSIARQNHDITWLTQPVSNEDHIPPYNPQSRSTMTFEQHIADVDFIVMGRNTFDVCMGFPHWPYPERKLLVLSATMQDRDLPGDSPPGGRVVASMEEVERILETEGAKMVYVDGGKTVQEFLRRGWVDEMVLTIAPVLLAGKGPTLFGDVGGDLPEDMHYTLVGVDVIEDGMVSCYYKVNL